MRWQCNGEVVETIAKYAFITSANLNCIKLRVCAVISHFYSYIRSIPDIAGRRIYRYLHYTVHTYIIKNVLHINIWIPGSNPWRRISKIPYVGHGILNGIGKIDG